MQEFPLCVVICWLEKGNNFKLAYVHYIQENGIGSGTRRRPRRLPARVTLDSSKVVDGGDGVTLHWFWGTFQRPFSD